MTLVLNVKNLKYGKYDITNESINKNYLFRSYLAFVFTSLLDFYFCGTRGHQIDRSSGPGSSPGGNIVPLSCLGGVTPIDGLYTQSKGEQ